MAKKKPNKVDGYSERHLDQLIRRRMIQRDHGDKNRYDRKDKSWKKDIDND